MRDEGLLTLAEGVRKMTGAVAARLGLTDRGTVTEGSWADLVVFDADTMSDRATWDDPREPAMGIRHVLVNGQAAIADGEATGARAGRFLTRNGG